MNEDFCVKHRHRMTSVDLQYNFIHKTPWRKNKNKKLCKNQSFTAQIICKRIQWASPVCYFDIDRSQTLIEKNKKLLDKLKSN